MSVNYKQKALRDHHYSSVKPTPENEGFNAFQDHSSGRPQIESGPQAFHVYKDDQDMSEEIRQGFISKVYGIISIQILITGVFVFMAVLTELGPWLLRNAWLAGLCLVGALVTEIMIICCKYGRKVPDNYICLFIFTFCESIVVATICAEVDEPFIVLISAFMTMVLVLTLTAYAWYTKNDFTVCGSIIWVLLSSFITLIILMLIFPSDTMYILYCAGGTIIFSFILIADTQMLKGDKSNRFSEDDYILAALMIYIDIITIFLKILEMVSKARR
ncbi:unnamed protein product [Moneuplotes crassus]|uniref:Uncharacterized protein n=1 Tax=Euplotes crassus TaxID=5936 RepID=A0AAD1XSK1_EUPCR|nr:unnamed protein product [Moneuplotes crassus]